MNKITSLILVVIVISVVIYFGLAILLIISGKPTKPTSGRGNLAFKELFIDYKSLPQLKTFTARDVKQLAYRFYPTRSDRVIILLHGSGWHSQYFLPLAKFISSEGLAQVYTPDLRGHGHTPERRGDIDYIDQLEDDLSDFVTMVRRDNPNSVLIISGHSSGGGLAIRFAGSKYGKQADAYMLLSPWLKYDAPTIRPGGGGWALPNTLRIIGLTMLNNVGIRWFNNLTVINFDMPEDVRDGTETLSYSYRLNTGYAPRDYKKDLRAITQPLLVVAGTSDEVFFADQFEPVISQFTKVKVRLVPNVTHMGVVVNPAVRPVIKEWLEGIGKPHQKAS
jgi:alpha-beta hydrolase superfamily lysophospholipase